MELIKRFTSPDGTKRIDINEVTDGLFQYAIWDDLYREDQDFQNPPFWRLVNESGLYASSEDAHGDAKAQFAWLSGTLQDDG